MKLSRATIALYVGLVFVCGGVVGFFANRLYSATTVSATAGKGGTTKSPAEYRKQLMDMFQKRLTLDDDQMQKLGVILDESQAQINAIHAQESPQIDAVRQNQITRMKLMLKNPDQQAEYDKMLQELRDRQKQKQRNGGGRPGGPGF